jgi:cation diffusion facilitator CzcD-associated flavoprotein CzcO
MLETAGWFKKLCVVGGGGGGVGGAINLSAKNVKESCFVCYS